MTVQTVNNGTISNQEYAKAVIVALDDLGGGVPRSFLDRALEHRDESEPGVMGVSSPDSHCAFPEQIAVMHGNYLVSLVKVITWLALTTCGIAEAVAATKLDAEVPDSVMVQSEDPKQIDHLIIKRISIEQRFKECLTPLAAREQIAGKKIFDMSELADSVTLSSLKNRITEHYSIQLEFIRCQREIEEAKRVITKDVDLTRWFADRLVVANEDRYAAAMTYFEQASVVNLNEYECAMALISFAEKNKRKIHVEAGVLTMEDSVDERELKRLVQALSDARNRSPTVAPPIRAIDKTIPMLVCAKTGHTPNTLQDFDSCVAEETQSRIK